MGFTVNEYDIKENGVCIVDAYINICNVELRWYYSGSDKIYYVQCLYRIYADKTCKPLLAVTIKKNITKAETGSNLCLLLYDHIKNTHFSNCTITDDD